MSGGLNLQRLGYLSENAFHRPLRKQAGVLDEKLKTLRHKAGYWLQSSVDRKARFSTIGKLGLSDQITAASDAIAAIEKKAYSCAELMPSATPSEIADKAEKIAFSVKKAAKKLMISPVVEYYGDADLFKEMTFEHVFFRLSGFIEFQGCTAPLPQPKKEKIYTVDCEGVPTSFRYAKDYVPSIKRMFSKRWVLRKLRKAHARMCEDIAITNHAVCGLDFENPKTWGAGTSAYVSKHSIEWRKERLKDNQNLMAGFIAYCADTGEKMSMDKIIDASVADPSKRRAECMIRMAGTEDWALSMGWVADFWTITCPSKMHPVSEKYDSTTPKQAQDYLVGVFSRIRAQLAREGIDICGFRVAEPHKSGCPHWHLVVFGHANDLERAAIVANHYALEMDGDEDGAQERRFVLEQIDLEKGSAIGYVAKYISKNIDGKKTDGESIELDGEDVDAYVNFVDVWRSVWGIRQFQFFGSHSVQVWRALRKLKPIYWQGADGKDYYDKEGQKHINIGATKNAYGAMYKHWQCVHNIDHGGKEKADFAAFLHCMDVEPIKLHTVETPYIGEYGEIIERLHHFEVEGFGMGSSLSIRCDFKEWFIVEARIFEKNPSWSPFNNCTDKKELDATHHKKEGEPPEIME